MDVSSQSVSASDSGSDEALLYDDDLLQSDDSTSTSNSGSEENSFYSGSTDYSASNSYFSTGEYSSGFYSGSVENSASNSYFGSEEYSSGFYSGSIDYSSHSGSEEYSEFYSGSFDYSDSYSESDSGLDLEDCTDISVAGDATYCIQDPICSGDGEKPTGYGCPSKGDVVVRDCVENVRSFLNGNCVAALDSLCHRLDSGAWGCVWEDEVGDTTGGTATDCTVVTVEGDATFCITGAICSGDGVSDRCPVSGDVAVGDCHDYLPSYLGGKCVAPSDAVCKQIDTGAWGCAWGNSDTAASNTIDNANGKTAGNGKGNGEELIIGVAVAAVVAGVIAAVVVVRSRQKRQHQHQHAEDSGYRMEPLTPPGSTRGNAAFHRVEDKTILIELMFIEVVARFVERRPVVNAWRVEGMDGASCFWTRPFLPALQSLALHNGCQVLVSYAASSVVAGGDAVMLACGDSPSLRIRLTKLTFGSTIPFGSCADRGSSLAAHGIFRFSQAVHAPASVRQQATKPQLSEYEFSAPRWQQEASLPICIFAAAKNTFEKSTCA